MKIGDVISRVDEIKPNAFSGDVKMEWLSILDGKVITDLFLMPPVEFSRPPYEYPADMETELLVDPPHDDIYSPWLQAQIDFANGEYSKYENTMTMFNSCWDSFAGWFAGTYGPAQGFNESLARPLPRVWR